MIHLRSLLAPTLKNNRILFDSFIYYKMPVLRTEVVETHRIIAGLESGVRVGECIIDILNPFLETLLERCGWRPRIERGINRKRSGKGFIMGFSKG
jgi:hypothetical protein